MSRRVVHGKRADGTFGLDIALAGYDAYTDDRNDAAKFSFCSDWTDLVPVAQIGIVAVPVSGGIGYLPIPIINNGYFPHVELRKIDSLRIFDDAFIPAQSGIGGIVLANQISITMTSVAYSAFYIVYKTPTAIQ